MSVKKQIPSLCKLYSFYEDLPEEFLDKIDAVSFFYRSIFDISQSQHRIVRVSEKKNSLIWSTVCAIFSKFLITVASVYRFPYRSLNLRLDLQS